jgi:hypothetical protein
MASSDPPPASGQPTTETKSPYENPLLHNLALGVTPLAALALALPPRRFDLRSVALGGTAMWGVFQLKYDYTGQSTLHRIMSPSSPSSSSSSGGGMYDLPPAALETQRRIREEKERRQRIRDLDARFRAQGVADETERKHRILAELEAQRRAQAAAGGDDKAGDEASGGKGTLESIWMGDADANWKETRAEKEREALGEGGIGIWGLIVEQVSDVFSRGEKKAQEEWEKQTKSSNSEGGDSKSS